MDFDRAAVIAAAEYLIRHPAETLPSWFKECVGMSGTNTRDNRWNIMYCVYPIFELAPNQHWEEISGGRVLVEVDQKTMESKFFISYHGPDPIEFFKISISKTDESAEILLDHDISHMNVAALERFVAK